MDSTADTDAGTEIVGQPPFLSDYKEGQKTRVCGGRQLDPGDLVSSEV